MDLDAAAVLFDNLGQVKDAAFYKQLNIQNGAVLHSGDAKTGDSAGDDEFIQLNVDQLPPNISIITFVVTAYQEGTFRQVETARAELRNGVELLHSRRERRPATADSKAARIEHRACRKYERPL